MGNVAQFMIASLERQGLIIKVGGHILRYVLPKSYALLTAKQQIGRWYVTREIEQLLVVLQGSSLKIGNKEQALTGSLNRNQLKYLVSKLYKDGIIRSEGTGRNTK